MKKMFLLLSLLITSAVAYANPIERVTKDIRCGDMPTVALTETDIMVVTLECEDDQCWFRYDPLYSLDDKRRFKGPVDQTLIRINNKGQVDLISLFVDSEEPRDYKVSEKVYKWLNKRYGLPLESSVPTPVWIWKINDLIWLDSVMIGSTGEEIAISFQCNLTEETRATKGVN